MDANPIEGLPAAAQWAIYVGGMLGAGIAGYLHMRRTRRSTRADSTLVLEAGTIADMKPVREIAGHLAVISIDVRRIADELVAAREDRRREEDIEREAERRAQQIIDERKRAPTRRR